MAFCPKCGTAVGGEDTFCRSCGRSLESSPVASEEMPSDPEADPSSGIREPLPELPASADRRGLSVKRVVVYVLVTLMGIGGSFVYRSRDASVLTEEEVETLREEVTALAGRNEDLRAAKREAEEAFAAQLAIFQTCRREVAPLLNGLRNVDARLDVGMSFAEYGEAIGDVSVAYNGMSAGNLDFDCLAVAVQGENAFNSYTRAYNIWNDCIGDFDCSTDAIEPDLQSQWLKASQAVGRAQRKLSGLRP